MMKNHSSQINIYPERAVNPHGFHGLVGLTRSIPFDIEKISLQPSVSKGKFSTPPL